MPHKVKYLLALSFCQEAILVDLLVLTLVTDETSEDLSERMVNLHGAALTTLWIQGLVQEYG